MTYPLAFALLGCPWFGYHYRPLLADDVPDPDPRDQRCETLTNPAASDHAVFFTRFTWDVDCADAEWNEGTDLAWDLGTRELAPASRPPLIGPAGTFSYDMVSGTVRDEAYAAVARFDPTDAAYPVLSPDGTRAMVWHASTDRVEDVSLVGGEDDFTLDAIQWPTWTDDSCLTSFVGRRYSEVDGVVIGCPADDAWEAALPPGAWQGPWVSDRFVAAQLATGRDSTLRFVARGDHRSFDVEAGDSVGAWARDGSTALVYSTYDPKDVVRVDLATGELESVGPSSSDLTAQPVGDGGYALLAGRTLSVLPAGQGLVEVARHVLSVTAADGAVVFADRDGQVERLDSDGTVTALAAWAPAAVHNVLALPDGTVLVDDHLDEVVRAIDPATGEVVAEAALPAP